MYFMPSWIDELKLNICNCAFMCGVYVSKRAHDKGIYKGGSRRETKKKELSRARIAYLTNRNIKKDIYNITKRNMKL
jgi:hypothetical protein